MCWCFHFLIHWFVCSAKKREEKRKKLEEERRLKEEEKKDKVRIIELLSLCITVVRITIC